MIFSVDTHSRRENNATMPDIRGTNGLTGSTRWQRLSEEIKLSRNTSAALLSHFLLPCSITLSLFFSFVFVESSAFFCFTSSGRRNAQHHPYWKLSSYTLAGFPVGCVWGIIGPMEKKNRVGEMVISIYLDTADVLIIT